MPSLFLTGTKATSFGFSLAFFPAIMCILGYTLITVEISHTQKNLERAWCILFVEVITWIVAHEEDGDKETIDSVAALWVAEFRVC